MFVDYLKVHVEAGNGGNGCVAFRREKYVPRGGPAGGDGGRGGNVIFLGHAKLSTLMDLRYHPHLRAEHGRHGQGNKRHGRDGHDLIVPVPLGTTFSDTETGEQIAEITHADEQWRAGRGGRGGRGNAQFATPTNQTPRIAEEGGAGETRELTLELKLIGDVGLVGLPNAGKSTLLARLTAATPKIGAYPFTTLHPNLGILEYDDEFRLTLADIPGLIEGAHQGQGLGDRFLRHIERTRLLVHLVGDENGVFDPEDMLYKYDLVQHELAAYTERLAERPQIVAISKTDLARDEADLEPVCRAFAERGLEALMISSESEAGLDALRQRLREEIEALDSEADQ